ncbi:MAG: hypothetical protein PF588_08815 [Candidatus Kapabacteria bacterium]|jgi:hypothetical protein|nr:hypothetical protein [Candidatus Kapabacteria bacterium]
MNRKSNLIQYETILNERDENSMPLIIRKNGKSFQVTIPGDEPVNVQITATELKELKSTQKVIQLK